MRDVAGKIRTYYEYNGKFYTVSNRRNLRLNDMFIDGRDYGVKIIEAEKDLFSMSFVDPELYVILEEVTIQN